MPSLFQSVAFSSVITSIMLLFTPQSLAETRYNCTIITSFTVASEPVYLSQFNQLNRLLTRDKIQVLHLMQWKDKLDARNVRRLRKQWQLSYRKNNAVLLDKNQQLLHRYDQGFDLVDAMMRCQQSLAG